MCEKIGSINGAILTLVGMSSSKSENVLTVEKVDKTLRNLEKNENNVRQMAENGRLLPLLTLLNEGPPETKLSMASYLGELALSKDIKVFVATTVGSSLINLMKSGNIKSKEPALKALNQVSSCESSAKILVDQGILSPLVKDLFAGHMQLKEMSATILANIVTSDSDFSSISVGPNHQTLVSEDIIHNLLYLISTGPAIKCKLLQVLVGLTSSPVTLTSVVSAIKSSGTIDSLVQFIEAPQQDLRMTSIKLLQNLSPNMSQELASSLRGTPSLLSSLIKVIMENITCTEEQAAAVGLLADLSERDIGLTRQMLDGGAFEMVISRIRMVFQGDQSRRSRFVTPYIEGLVRVLSRITFMLADEPKAVSFCRDNDLAGLFVDLLQVNGLDNVQMVSAFALENLSQQSKNLTKLPEMPIFHFFSKQPVMTVLLCRVHRGVCSQRDTFCLLEGAALPRLVALLDHTNEKLIEASLAALATLLDDGVNIEGGVAVLCEVEGLKPILDVLLEKQTDSLWRRAIWVVERLLRTEDVVYEVSGDPNVSTALVQAFQHGDYQTSQISECALKHIDKIPNFSNIFVDLLNARNLQSR
ncbi:hypothetical protein L1887_16230 [Cichorium endivia]|nr:hypothetical protein L1887_16230 [Cichorium endivia]